MELHGCAVAASGFYPIASLGHHALETCWCFNCIAPLAYLNQISHCLPHSQKGDSEDGPGVFVVTGGNRGVGYHTASVLLQQGHTVLLLSRSLARGQDARHQLIRKTRCAAAAVKVYEVDLSNLDTIYSFINDVEAIKSIRGLANNAGLIGSNAIMVNHLGHFALTMGLLTKLQQGSTKYGLSYIANVSSVASWEGSNGLRNAITEMSSVQRGGGSNSGSWTAYASSKAGIHEH